MVELVEARDQYLTAFDSYIEHVSNREPAWMTELRKQAAAYFRETGFPHRQVEEWRFTNIRPILESSFEPAPQASHVVNLQIQDYTFAQHCYVLVFLNGFFSPKLSSQEAVKSITIKNLEQALQDDSDLVEPYYSRLGSYQTNAFAALNTAFAQNGAFIYIPRDTEFDKPIHILHIQTSPDAQRLCYPRNLLVAGGGSKASVVESYIGLGQDEDTYFTNALTEVVVGEKADIEHCRIQRESRLAYHISSMQIYMEHAARFQTQSIMLGGAITRNEVIAKLDAEDIKCTLNGLYMPKGAQHVENHTLIEHAKPNCNSWELYKGILDDKASGVFRGKIYVAQDAQKTDSKQSNNAMLLSDHAQINTMPQLEIYADDVKCTHGATTGHLDEDKIFYLRSRGIPLEEAKGLLIHAFASEIIQCVPVKIIQAELQRILFSQLPLRVFEKE